MGTNSTQVVRALLQALKDGPERGFGGVVVGSDLRAEIVRSLLSMGISNELIAEALLAVLHYGNKDEREVLVGHLANNLQKEKERG